MAELGVADFSAVTLGAAELVVYPLGVCEIQAGRQFAQDGVLDGDGGSVLDGDGNPIFGWILE